MMKLGLVGFPVAHSKSPKIFQDFFSEHKIAGTYDLIPLPTEAEIDGFIRHDIFAYDGLNVTIPFKEIWLDKMTQLSPEAENIGALNTIVVKNGELIGYNTDVYGFMKIMQPYIPHAKKALVLGSGGSSKAVKFVLSALQIPHAVVSRNPKNMEISYKEFNNAVLSEYNLIINTTPLGMKPYINECAAIPYEFIGLEHICIDLIYNPLKTEYLVRSEKQGAQICNGFEMLKEQAFFSFNLFTQ